MDFSGTCVTNIHHVSGHSWKGFDGQRSNVNVIFSNCLQLCYYDLYSLEGIISDVQMCECYNGKGIHFDAVALRLTCCCLVIEM